MPLKHEPNNLKLIWAERKSGNEVEIMLQSWVRKKFHVSTNLNLTNQVSNVSEEQCDQIFDQKVAQIYPTVVQKWPQLLFLEYLCF